MAIRIALHCVCDRCQKPFEEQNIEYGQELPKYERKEMKLTLGDHVVLSFHDLCPDCRNVVDGFIKRIRLDPEPRKPKKDKDIKDAPDVPPEETGPGEPEKSSELTDHPF